MILIIGTNGLLGNFLYKNLSKNFDVLGTSYKDYSVDLLNYNLLDPISSIDVIWENISYVIVTAACSKVGFCEDNPIYSKEVNLYSNIKLLKFLRKKNIPIILFSSEYVFDGEEGHYKENSLKNPLTEYGRQKSSLENDAFDIYEKCTIFRISKIASLNEKGSFLFKMIEDMSSKKEYYALKNQFFTPILIEDCLEIIKITIEKKIYGLFNLCGFEHYSRYSLALELKENFQLKTKIKSCILSDLDLKYKLPLDLTMDCSLLRKKFEFNPQPINY